MRIDGRKKKICRYDPPLARENENKRNSRIPVSTRKDDPRAGLCQSARRKREKTRARENGKAEGGGADACNRGGGGLHRVILFLSLAAVASSVSRHVKTTPRLSPTPLSRPPFVKCLRHSNAAGKRIGVGETICADSASKLPYPSPPSPDVPLIEARFPPRSGDKPDAGPRIKFVYLTLSTGRRERGACVQTRRRHFHPFRFLQTELLLPSSKF